MNFIFLLFPLELLLFAGAFYLSKKDILAPSVVFSGMFVLSTFVAILNLGTWDYSLGGYTCFLLVLGILTYVLTEWGVRELVTRRLPGKMALGEKSDLTPYHVQGWKVIALLLFNILIVIWYYVEIRRIVAAYGMDTSNLFASYRQITVKLAMPSDSEIPMIGTVLSQMLKVVKASLFIASFIVVHNLVADVKWWKKKPVTCIGLALCTVIALMTTLFSGGRMLILELIASMIIEYYIFSNQKNGWNIKNQIKKYVIIGLICVIIGIPLFYLTLRMIGRNTTQSIWEHASIYIGSGVVNFDKYVKEPIAAPKVFGEETLLGVHQLIKRLGFPTVVKSYHLENRNLDAEGLLRSNIYTFFRSPLHDFGVIGMCCFTICVSAFYAWLYYKKIYQCAESRWQPYWILVYASSSSWYFCSSIVQRSGHFLTTSMVLVFAAILIGFFLMTQVDIVFENRRLRIKINAQKS